MRFFKWIIFIAYSLKQLRILNNHFYRSSLTSSLIKVIKDCFWQKLISSVTFLHNYFSATLVYNSYRKKARCLLVRKQRDLPLHSWHKNLVIYFLCKTALYDTTSVIFLSKYCTRLNTCLTLYPRLFDLGAFRDLKLSW